MTRYIGCNLFVERARAADIATPNDAILADSYTKACEDAIAACPAVAGIFDFVDCLRSRDVACFFVSGTPQQSMRDTVVWIGLNE